MLLHRMRVLAMAALAAGSPMTLPATAVAQGMVDLELALLADASGSIDAAEIRFQRQRYASAITDPAVVKVITGGWNQKIALTYVGERLTRVTLCRWLSGMGPETSSGQGWRWCDGRAEGFAIGMSLVSERNRLAMWRSPGGTVPGGFAFG